MEDVKCHFHIYLCSPNFVKCKVLTGEVAGKIYKKKQIKKNKVKIPKKQPCIRPTTSITAVS